MSRPHYYQLIEEVVSQIVLHRNGLDPDFRGRFTLDVAPLIEGFANTQAVSLMCDTLLNSPL
jgi:hypothetical protein